VARGLEEALTLTQHDRDTGYQGGKLNHFVTASKELFKQKESEIEAQRQQTKALHAQIDAAEATLLVRKQQTLEVMEVLGEVEEEEAHRRFEIETKRGEEIRQLRALHTVAQADITATEERGKKAVSAMNESLRSEEQRHSTHMVDLRSALEYDSSAVKGLLSEVAQMERAKEDEMDLHHANADGMEMEVRGKEVAHAEALAAHKRGAMEQRDKMSMLKELPQVLFTPTPPHCNALLTPTPPHC